jgi:hypothetical protein
LEELDVGEDAMGGYDSRDPAVATIRLPHKSGLSWARSYTSLIRLYADSARQLLTDLKGRGRCPV